MNIRAFGTRLGLLLALALVIPVQVFAQDEPQVFTSLDIQNTPIIAGVDTTFAAVVTILNTIDAWSYTEVHVNGGFYGCFDTPDLPAAAIGPVNVTIPVQGVLTTAGTYTVRMFQADNSTCDDLFNEGAVLVCTEGGACPQDTLVVQNVATVTITKDFSEDHPTADSQASITLTCPTGIIDGEDNSVIKTTTGFTAVFTVRDFPTAGENCTATETVPAGYVQQSATGCNALALLPAADDVACTIVNRPTQAVFQVDKNFSDANAVLPAVVTPLCTDAGGGPGITYSAASGNALHGTNFSTTVKYFAGATNCTATEVDLTGYTQDAAQSTCDEGGAITDAADGSCIIFNGQDPVTILASKEYGEGSGPTATFAASCEEGTVTTITAIASVGVPAEFEISDFPFDGTTCDVTEPVPPPGFYELSSTCNDLAIGLSDADTLCTITNGETRTTFQVTKEFTDGDNPTEVEVTIDCFSGLPITQSQTIDETQDVTFVVTNFTSEELDCEITEEELNGYTPTFEPGGPGTFDADGGCNFEDVAGGAENTCHIVNDADPVDVEIEKLWVIEGSNADQVDTSYKLTLYCDAQITDASYCHSNIDTLESPAGNGNSWECKKSFYGDGSQVFTGHVTPEYPSSHCWVEEEVNDSSVEIDNDCGNIIISAGNGDSCVITNTVFFEGIPTLSQYGMAILALLMLGVGLVGFRRFA